MDAPQQDRAGVITLPPLIYIAVFVLGNAADGLKPLPIFGSGKGFAAGLILIAAGLVGAAWAVVSLLRNATAVNPYKSTTRIVKVGPFRYSRNPIYLADLFIYGGFALILDTWWPLILVPALVWIMTTGVIQREERYLTQKFGEQYAAYRKQTRRWV